MMINRETAVSYLTDIINSGYFSENLRSSLEEIRYCIEAEMKGFHVWNAEDDHIKLFSSSGDNSEEIEKYRFTPSKYENG